MAGSAASARVATAAIWTGLGLVLLFLYAPLVPPAIHSFEGAGGGVAGLLRNYAAIFEDERLLRALWNSVAAGLMVALIAPALALLAAEVVRVWRMPRLIIAIVLLYVFPEIGLWLPQLLYR